MAKKKEATKKTTTKKPAAKKTETNKFDLGKIDKEKDLKVGNTITVQNERYDVMEGNKLRNKVTGKEVTY